MNRKYDGGMAEPPHNRLAMVSAKLRALGHFIAVQRPDAGPPRNAEDINRGLGALLSELADTVTGVARCVEQEHMSGILREHRSRRRKRRANGVQMEIPGSGDVTHGNP